MQLTLRRRITATDIVIWAIGLSILVAVIWGTAATLSTGKYTLANWIDLFILGIVQGSIYALIALGYTMVYGILRMINFSHGEVFMSGPFTAYFVINALNQNGFLEANPILALLIVGLVSMIVSVVVAVLVERIAYRPLRGAPRLVPLITAIGASFFLQYTFRGFYGSGIKAYPNIPMLEGSWIVWGIRIFRGQVVVIVAAVILMLILYTVVQKTKIGKAMRAVSEDKDVAALMGINVDRIIQMTFVLGGAAAGAAGMLYALIFKQVHFFMGFFPGLKAFTAAVLGGIGNIPGAMFGAITLGIVESLGPNLFLDGLGIPAPYQLKDAIAFTILVLILIFRPTGILGERLTEAKA